MVTLAVVAAATFNLVCSGITHTDSMFPHKPDEPFTYTFRVDLDRKVYCDGDCKATVSFANVLPTQLQLNDQKTDTPSEKSMDFTYIDRQTGEYNGSYTFSDPRDRMSILLVSHKGHCERADFTGFPTFQTKF